MQHIVPTSTATSTRPDQRTGAEPALTRPARVNAILDQVEAHLPHVDPDLQERGREALAAARTAEAPCPVYRDCEAVGPHYDHYNHSGRGLEVTDGTGESILDAGFAALSSDDPHERRPAVYLRGTDFDSQAELVAKVDEIRRMLDATVELGARVFADHDGHPEGPQDLARIDEQATDGIGALISLLVHRRQVACRVVPAATPLDESDGQQESSAAFSLALRALDVALDKAPNRGQILDAIRYIVSPEAQA
ncbi:hypothetical protein [Streptomyces sp. NPDC048392]|uniref:hypothetical protein n=1 Tax=Streptomyces sp. NPDC048392 TaxID=3365543 RepID=UPI0037184228